MWPCACPAASASANHCAARFADASIIIGTTGFPETFRLEVRQLFTDWKKFHSVCVTPACAVVHGPIAAETGVAPSRVAKRPKATASRPTPATSVLSVRFKGADNNMHGSVKVKHERLSSESSCAAFTRLDRKAPGKARNRELSAFSGNPARLHKWSA